MSKQIKVHMLASGKETCKRFKLPKGKKWYSLAYMNGDRRNICIVREEDQKQIKRYIKPHTMVVVE